MEVLRAVRAVIHWFYLYETRSRSISPELAVAEELTDVLIVTCIFHVPFLVERACTSPRQWGPLPSALYIQFSYQALTILPIIPHWLHGSSMETQLYLKRIQRGQCVVGWLLNGYVIICSGISCTGVIPWNDQLLSDITFNVGHRQHLCTSIYHFARIHIISNTNVCNTTTYPSFAVAVTQLKIVIFMRLTLHYWHYLLDTLFWK